MTYTQSTRLQQQQKMGKFSIEPPPLPSDRLTSLREQQETMKKTQIVAEMAEKTGLNKTQSEAALVAFLETVSDALGGK